MPMQAEEPGLVIVKHAPFNAEAAPVALGAILTPTAQFYVRSNYAVPVLDTADWHLTVEGAVATPLRLSWADVQALPAQRVTTTLECAGNGRTGFLPLPKGEPWTLGAVSTAGWRGVPLRTVLAAAGLQPTTVEVLFEGADCGPVEGAAGDQPFARSLPLAQALDPETLLVYEMNDAPLPAAHGGPLRLVVPDWYGIASVKWLVRIVALDTPFTGYYQTQRYVYDYPPAPEQTPVQTMRVRALITSPLTGGTVPPTGGRISGMAWSGEGPIRSVEVSLAGDGPWQPAQLVGSAPPHAWQPWTFALPDLRPGRYVFRARATDAAGHVQPDQARWNRLGYANNSIQPVIVDVPAL